MDVLQNVFDKRLCSRFTVKIITLGVFTSVLYRIANYKWEDDCMECTVFYESWQMECCGRAFSIGDTVEWLVYQTEPGEILSPVDIGPVDYCYEQHSSDWKKLLILEGKVEAIKILYERFKQEKDDYPMLVSTGGELVDAERAEGFEKSIGDMKPTGYVVRISEYSVRPAKRKDVTFQ